MKSKKHSPKPVVPADGQVTIKAVIDIGATSLRMAVAEIYPDQSWKVIETLQQSLSLGRDSFNGGKIKFSTIETCVGVLQHFKKSLAESWGITSTDAIRAVATSAVREASNCDQFINRIRVATGIRVRAIEGAEVNRLTFLAVRPLIEQHPELAADNLLLIEVGGGNTEIMGFYHGQVDFAQTHSFGAFRIREMIESSHEPGIKLEEVLEKTVAGTVRAVQESLESGSDAEQTAESPGNGSRKAQKAEQKIRILALGGECRLAAQCLVRSWDGKSLVKIPLKALGQLVKSIMEQPVEALVAKYHIAPPEAETLGPALLAYVHLARHLGVKSIYVGTQNLRTGLLAEIAGAEGWTESFVGNILHSAWELGRKYHFDEKHATYVTACALKLFETMQNEHRLAAKYGTILEVAGILHDIGMFISNRSHHKHSKYLIDNTEIFGLSSTDRMMTALVARYHRRADPKPSHPEYVALPGDLRIALIQLASILRLTDALDTGHEQRLGDIEFEMQGKNLMMNTRYRGSLSAEKVALEGKGELFKSVFGLQPILQTQK